MKRFGIFLLISAITGLYGCTTADVNALDAGKGKLDYPAKITSSLDEAVGLLRQRGPDIAIPTGLFGTSSYHLQRLRRADNEVFNVMVHMTLENWAHFSGAYADGVQYPFVSIDKRIMSCSSYGCSLVEDFAVDLTRAQLTAYAGKPMRMAFTGVRARSEITIPAAYIDAMLALNR